MLCTVGLNNIEHLCIYTNNEKSLTPIFRGTGKFRRDRDRCSEQLSLWGTAKFWRDRDKCNKISDVTIPYSNISPGTAHNWFVSCCTPLPTKKCNIVDTNIKEGSEI